MAGEIFPRLRSSRPVPNLVNRHSATLERHDRLVGTDPVCVRQNGTTSSVTLDRLAPFDAKITAVSGRKHEWVEQVSVAEATWETPALARSGTASFAPAYARGNGTANVGDHVVLWPQQGGTFYLFDAAAAAGASLTARELDDDPYLTNVRTLAVDQHQGMELIGPLTITAFNGVTGVITTATPHKLQDDDFATVSGVTGAEDVNGEYQVRVVNPTQLQLLGLGGLPGPYTGGTLNAGEARIRNATATDLNPGIVSLTAQHLGKGTKTADAFNVGGVTWTSPGGRQALFTYGGGPSLDPTGAAFALSAGTLEDRSQRAKIYGNTGIQGDLTVFSYDGQNVFFRTGTGPLSGFTAVAYVGLGDPTFDSLARVVFTNDTTALYVNGHGAFSKLIFLREYNAADPTAACQAQFACVTDEAQITVYSRSDALLNFCGLNAAGFYLTSGAYACQGQTGFTGTVGAAVFVGGICVGHT